MVGVVTLTCDFDLDRYVEIRDTGNCYRPDGGLLAAALSVADQWEAAANTRTGRAGCSPARLTKLAALSGNADPGPRYVEIATSISEEIHRSLIMETEGILAAKAAEKLRHEKREPIGLLMIRGVSEIRHPRSGPEADGEAEESEARLLLQACAARDTADFAVELIRHRWPVSPRASR